MCTASMIYINNGYVRITYDLHDDASFRDEELWESENLLDATHHMSRIFDAKYKKDDLSKIVSDSKHLSTGKKECFMTH